MLTEEMGRSLLTIARKNIAHYLTHQEMLPLKDVDVPPEFTEKRGVFVTLKKHGDLRGCIGYPEPVFPLITALLECSVAAALEDPRFRPVTLTEMEEIEVEVTVLTTPEEIIPAPENVRVGEDGLMVERGIYSGLLLPQVAVEWEWDAEEFLCETCMKAGLPPDCWLDKETKVYTFQGQIFSE